MATFNKETAFRYYSRLIFGLNVIAASLVFLMAVMITGNVLMRKYLGYNLEWLFDFTQYALVYITFLAGGWLTRQEGHIRVDLLHLLLPAHLGRRLEYFNIAFAGVICLILFWLSATATWYQYLAGNVSPAAVPVPNWMLWIVMPVGFLAMACEFAITMIRKMSNHQRLSLDVQA